MILVLGKSALSVPDTRFSRVSGSTLVFNVSLQIAFPNYELDSKFSNLAAKVNGLMRTAHHPTEERSGVSRARFKANVYLFVYAYVSVCAQSYT